MRTRTVVSAVVFCLLVGGATFAQPIGTPVAMTNEAVTMESSVDLVVRDLGLSAAGDVVFSLQNRGGISINPGQFTSAINTVKTPPIRIDLYFGGSLIQSVYQPSLARHESQTLTVRPMSAIPIPKCKEPRALKVVVDPMNAVKELHDDNNSAAGTVTRPCPDLAIKSIERQAEGLMKETYRVKVTVVNLGNAPAPSSQAWGTALSSAPGLTGWPELVPVFTIPPLMPGETSTFKVGGSVMSFDNSWVKIFLDRDHHVEELDETNNFIDKKI
jgi:CARDB protein